MIGARERYQYLKAALQDLANVPDAPWNSRKLPHPILRALVWYQMRLEGYSSLRIAIASGFTHSTVIVQSNKIKDIILSKNPSWRDIIILYKKLQVRIAANPQQETITNNSVRAMLIREILNLPKEERDEFMQELRYEISHTKEREDDEQVPQSQDRD